MGSSFAYRKGRSWLDALRRVERHRDQGLTWVYRCDIRSFFDEIDHEVLTVILECLFPRSEDVDLLMRWISAPRVGPRGTHDGQSGLPLGLPLSGALANAYLTPFDLGLTQAGRKLVRYADDSVVCCRTREEAEAAMRACHHALYDLRLEANPEKSHISSLANGFSFLGWTFLGDHGYQSDQQRDWVHPLAYSR